MHRRLLTLFEEHAPHNAHRAVVRRSLVAITDVQATVSVQPTVNRDDHAESGVTGRVDAHLRRTHEVSSGGSGVVGRACASTHGVQFVVARCAPPGEAGPASPECLVAV